MLPQAQEHLRLPEAGGGEKGTPLEVSERAWPCQHFDYRLLASTTETTNLF